jgi:CRISPR/Cas system-associated exonuclease Cas4 (RecB family)
LYPSVTQIIGILNNPALNQWFIKNTPEFVRRESGKGRTIGTDIHKSLENYILTGQATVETEYPEEVTCALHSFIKFRKERPDIFIEWSEMALTSEKHGYNGTIDAIGKTDKNLVLPDICIDWKSGKAGEKDAPDIYDSYKVQVAAYTFLYNEVKQNCIDRAIIVSIAKDKVAYNVYEMGHDEIFDCFNEVFLPALRIYNYQKRGSKNILL